MQTEKYHPFDRSKSVKACRIHTDGSEDKHILKLKEKHKTVFFSPSENWCLPAPSTLNPEEREFVVDSRAPMHMISKKDLNSAELETVTTSRSPTTVVTANGGVQTHEEATVCVKELDIFLTMKVFEDTPAVLSPGKLCDEHGYSYEWINGQKPHLIKNGIRIQCNTENFVPIVDLGLSTSSSSSLPTSAPMTPSRQEIDHSKSSSKQSSLVNDEEVIRLSHAKVYVFSDSVLCHGKVNQKPTSNTAWEQQLDRSKDSSQYRIWDTIDGNSSGIVSQDSIHWRLVREVPKFMNKMGEPDQFQGRIIIMSMFNDIIWRSEDNAKECIANSTLVSLFAKRFPAGRWSFLGPGSETKWYSTDKERSGGKWDRVAELMMIKFGESGPPVCRATSPLSRGTHKSKGGGTFSIHFCADEGTMKTVFAQLFSVNQLSIYGAVSDLCEEYKSCHVRKVRPVLVGQSHPLFVPKSSLMKTPTPSTDDPAQEDFLQKHKERAGNLSQLNRVIKCCIDAGFLKTVEVGQHFMTKHTDENKQFAEPVTCSEYTLPRDEKPTNPKGWIRENWARVGSHNQLLAR